MIYIEMKEVLEFCQQSLWFHIVDATIHVKVKHDNERCNELLLNIEVDMQTLSLFYHKTSMSDRLS
jgi:hypothetical protein